MKTVNCISAQNRTSEYKSPSRQKDFLNSNANLGGKDLYGFKKTLLLIIFLAFTSVSYSHLSLTGYYQGKNLQIENQEDGDGFGFCITKITVNGNPITQNIQSKTFEIDLASIGLKIGEPVIIVIEHCSSGNPIILNPEAINAVMGFEKQNTAHSPNHL